jgi:hypothetical protein
MVYPAQVLMNTALNLWHGTGLLESSVSTPRGSSMLKKRYSPPTLVRCAEARMINPTTAFGPERRASDPDGGTSR